MRVVRLVLCTIALVSGVMMLPAVAASQETGRRLDVIELKGVIDPTSADYLTGRLAVAERDGVEAAVIQMDTPGGLDVSMRSMIQRILATEVPVIVWVAPRGARAASAGTFIAYAANLAFMAEATEIGAATPVNLGGGDVDETLARKITNDAVAMITELARTRGRDVEA
jgi:membrane-bound serine protease (ClpP class)